MMPFSGERLENCCHLQEPSITSVDAVFHFKRNKAEPADQGVDLLTVPFSTTSCCLILHQWAFKFPLNFLWSGLFTVKALAFAGCESVHWVIFQLITDAEDLLMTVARQKTRTNCKLFNVAL